MDTPRTRLVDFLQNHSIYNGDQKSVFQDTYQLEVTNKNDDSSTWKYKCKTSFRDIIVSGSSEPNARNDAAQKLLDQLQKSLESLTHADVMDLTTRLQVKKEGKNESSMQSGRGEISKR